MYETFYGLKSSPFQLSPDPSFMFASEKCKEAITSISYAISRRKGFVVMTGEVGTGKTLVLRCLFELWEHEQIPYAYFIGPRLSTADFLSYITFELGIKAKESSKGNMLRALYGFLLAQFDKGLTTVLVIDEAHQMPRSVLEEIRVLANFETAQQKLIQIVLAGQPELEKKLDSVELRSLKQRIAVRCQLEPLREDEVRRYILHRLELAGADAKAANIFPPETVRAIYSYSAGIPRLINNICDQALISAYAHQYRVIPTETVHEVARRFRLDRSPRLKHLEEPFVPPPFPDKSWLVLDDLTTPVMMTSGPDTDFDVNRENGEAGQAASASQKNPTTHPLVTANAPAEGIAPTASSAAKPGPVANTPGETSQVRQTRPEASTIDTIPPPANVTASTFPAPAAALEAKSQSADAAAAGSVHGDSASASPVVPETQSVSRTTEPGVMAERSEMRAAAAAGVAAPGTNLRAPGNKAPAQPGATAMRETGTFAAAVAADLAVDPVVPKEKPKPAGVETTEKRKAVENRRASGDAQPLGDEATKSAAPAKKEAAPYRVGPGETYSASSASPAAAPSAPRADNRSLRMPRWLEPGLHLTLLITACAIVPVALATGVFMANRQKPAKPLAHQASSASRSLNAQEVPMGAQPIPRSSASQPVASRGPAEPARESILSRHESVATPAESGVTETRPNFLTGPLPKPVTKAHTVSSAAEPPTIAAVQAKEDFGRDLLAPSPPAPVVPVSNLAQLQEAKPMFSPAPIYPAAARLEQVEGVVVIDAQVNELGRISEMKVVSGAAVLRASALEALRTWKYEPARLNGQPIASHVQVSIRFNLR